jgi:hypothetical protein
MLRCKWSPKRRRSVGYSPKQSLESRDSGEALRRYPYPLEHQALELAQTDSTLAGHLEELDLTSRLGDAAQSS